MQILPRRTFQTRHHKAALDPVPVAAAAFTLVGSSVGNAAVATLPAGIQQNDFALCFNYVTRAAAPPAQIVGDGFAILRDKYQGQDGSDAGLPSARGIVSWKRLTGGETGLDIMNGFTGEDFFTVVVWRPDTPFWTPTDHDTGNNTMSAGNLAPQTIGSSAAASLCLAYGQMCAAIAVSTRTAVGLTEIAGASSPFAGQYVHWAEFDTGGSPTNFTYDKDDDGNRNLLQSGYLTFAWP